MSKQERSPYAVIDKKNPLIGVRFFSIFCLSDNQCYGI